MCKLNSTTAQPPHHDLGLLHGLHQARVRHELGEDLRRDVRHPAAAALAVAVQDEFKAKASNVCLTCQACI